MKHTLCSDKVGLYVNSYEIILEGKRIMYGLEQHKNCCDLISKEYKGREIINVFESHSHAAYVVELEDSSVEAIGYAAAQKLLDK